MRALHRDGRVRAGGVAAIGLLQRIAVVANEAASLSDAIQAALDEVCAHTGWPVGHAYLLVEGKPDELAPTAIWHMDDAERFATFREVTERTSLTRGTGLPGRILVSGRPAWIMDVTADPNFPRARVAADLGVKGAFGFPLLANDRVVGVLEFFSETPEPPDAELLDLMSYVGTQLGRVAEREAAARALVAQVEHTRLLIDSAYDAFVSIDGDGTIRRWNSAAESMFGWSRTEAIGRTLADTIVPPAHRAAHVRGIGRFLATGEGPILNQRLELTALRRDGREFPVELAVWPVAEADGYTFSAFIRDITDRKRAENALKEAFERERGTVVKLRELDQAKTIFTSSVSHELRTPLTSIIGYLDLLRESEKGQLTETQLELLGVVKRNSRRLLELIEDLLTFSRLQSGTFVPSIGAVGLPELFTSVREAVLPQAASRALDLRFEPVDGFSVAGDGAQLESVLQNLLSNAIKFTPPGGCVSVGATQENGTVTITVTDTGIGVPTGEIPKLFSPFFRSSNAEGLAVPGTGLGLAIVKAIVDGHHGEIEIASDEGKGTTVSVRLPAAHNVAAE